MHLFCKLAASCLFVSALPAVNCAQANQAPTLEQNISLKLASSPRISPDARYIAYEIRETDWKENKFIRQLWLVNVATGKNFQLTRGKHDSGNAEWSPDGHWLAFVTERELSAVEPRAETEKKEESKDSKKEETGRRGQTCRSADLADLPGGRRSLATDRQKRTSRVFIGQKTGIRSCSRRTSRKPNRQRAEKRNTVNTM